METAVSSVMVVLVMGVFIHCGRHVAGNAGAERYQEEAGQIYTTVFHKYKKNVRPPDYYPDPVPVKVDASMVHIRGLDVLRQELESIIDLNIQWQDKRLAWYANKVVMITEELSAVWHPSVVYRNGAVPPKPLFSSKVSISKDGMLSWHRREIVTTICPTAPRNTSQLCDVQLGFTSPESMEVFDNATEFTIEPYFSNHEWDLVAARVETEESQETIRFVLQLELVHSRGDGLGNNCSVAAGLEMSNGAGETLSGVVTRVIGLVLGALLCIGWRY